MFISRILRLVTLGVALSSIPLQAAVIWNEAVDGELSNNPAAPTKIEVFVGDNNIIGSISGPVVANVSGYDEANFTVPPNTVAFSVTLESYGPDATNTSLLNLYQGAAGEGFGVLLASGPLAVDHIGMDIFSDGVAFTPLTVDLEAGTDYTLEIREGGAAQDYDLRITAAPIPEPSSAGLLLLGVLALAWRRRRE